MTSCMGVHWCVCRTSRLVWVAAGINWLSVAHADVGHNKKGILCDADPFLLRPPHSGTVRLSGSSSVCGLTGWSLVCSVLVCCHYCSSTLWLTASAFVHPYCVISTFSTVEYPRWLVTSSLLFRHECQEVNIMTLSDMHAFIFGWPTGGHTYKCKSLWLIEWLSDEVTASGIQIMSLAVALKANEETPTLVTYYNSRSYE